jgi:hypothetical protein
VSQPSVARPLAPRWLAIGVGLLSMVIVVADLALVIVTFSGQDVVFVPILLTLIVSLTIVGTVLATRRGDNPIGWMLLFAGLAAGLSTGGGSYVEAGRVLRLDLPLTVPLAWLASWMFVPTLGTLAVFLPMLFPTGRFLGPRWAWAGRLAGVAIAVSVAAGALAPGPLSSTALIDNPVAVGEPLAGILAAAAVISNALAPILFAVAVASLIVRFRRSTGIERQQLKWFLFVASFATLGLAIAIPNVGPASDVGWLVGLAALAVLPLAIGLAIVRYRLYDIDRIVSRAIAYATVTTILAATFAVLILATQTILAPVLDESRLGPIGVAASTLVVASLFQPLRRRVQRLADRRFDRALYDADRLVAAFVGRLRDVTALEPIRDDLLTTVDDVVRPATAHLWLRRNDPGTDGA